MIAACLMFDSKFSFEGWLCYKSIKKFQPTLKVYVLCLDERVFVECKYFQHFDGDVIPIKLYDFENAFPELFEARKTRQWAPYTQTCKTFLPIYVFNRYKEEKIFYVDSDVYFWGDCFEIEKALGDYSFLASPVEMEPPPPQGMFNAGCFACRNNEFGRKFMRWWEERVLEWCLWELGPNGKFVDQGYLNIIMDQPEKFEGIGICTNPGINFAPWNNSLHKIDIKDNKVVLDDVYDLISYHYVGTNITKNGYGFKAEKPLNYIYETYYKEYITFREEFLNGLDSYWGW